VRRLTEQVARQDRTVTELSQELERVLQQCRIAQQALYVSFCCHKCVYTALILAACLSTLASQIILLPRYATVKHLATIALGNAQILPL